MRGRKPRYFTMAPADVPVLQQLARSQTRPWYQVQHARMVLTVTAGERIQRVASQVDCDPTTVWRMCRRYEQRGVAGVVARAPRTGRPLRISPLQRAQIVQLACLEPDARLTARWLWTLGASSSNARTDDSEEAEDQRSESL